MTLPILHATAIARWDRGGWGAVLLRGPSGSGKSDLALRALAAGWRLAADDRVLAWASGGRLFGRAPARLAGLVEARGLGVLPVADLPWAELVLVADLAAAPEDLERIPAPDSVDVAGVKLPRIDLFAREPSALAKLSLALQAVTLGAKQEPAYQARRTDEAEAPDALRGPLMRNR